MLCTIMASPICILAVCSFVILSAHCQLSVIWNGTVITSPVLIYLDEVLVDHYSNATIGDPKRPGALICKSENSSRVSWHYTDGVIVSDAPIDERRGFIQTRTAVGVIPSVSRFSTSSADAPMNTGSQFNGVWHCRLNAQGITLYDQQINVDIFSRGGGRGSITAIGPMILLFTSFASSPPTFTLNADTIGGPPTNYTWTRDDEVITQNDSYSISFAVNGTTNEVYQQSHYRSTLRVTGRLPGVYMYTVTNRATPTILTSNFTIEDATPPINLSAAQTGLNSVLVSWTTPSPPPARGFQVIAQPGGISMAANASVTSRSIIVQETGIYVVTVVSLSQHLPSDEERQIVTVRATKAPNVTTSSVNAVSATVSWTQPSFSFSPMSFTVTVTQITGTQQALCTDVMDTRTSVNTTANTNSLELTSLQEFSTYKVTVTAYFSVFSITSFSSESTLFNTLMAVPTGAPQEVNFSTTSRSTTVTWEAVECIERNGVITGYRVEFLDQDGAGIHGEMMNQNFTASGLTPHTNYTFRVAALNNEGLGPFSDITTVTTDQDIPGPVTNLTAEKVSFTSIVLTWSAPQEPNGVIIAYEITYRADESNIFIENTTEVSITLTLELLMDTMVSDISVRAYTIIGPGNVTELDDVLTPEQPVTRILMIQMTETTTEVNFHATTAIQASPTLRNDSRLLIASGVMLAVGLASLLSAVIIVVVVMTHWKRNARKGCSIKMAVGTDNVEYEVVDINKTPPSAASTKLRDQECEFTSCPAYNFPTTMSSKGEYEVVADVVKPPTEATLSSKNIII